MTVKAGRRERGFEEWRAEARRRLHFGQPPEDVDWEAWGAGKKLPPPEGKPGRGESARVPREFLELARIVACHADPERWRLLYRLAWRAAAGERLLERKADHDVAAARAAEREVLAEVQRLRGGVELAQVATGIRAAWAEPSHHVLPLLAPALVRTATAPWVLLTPRASAWLDDKLHFGAGVAEPASRAELARMAKGKLSQSALALATSADDFVPKDLELARLAKSSKGCTGCELHAIGTQVVFGEGPPRAEILIVGEVPGDEEDLAGRPFVGPAGRVLGEALEAAGLDWAKVYVTNAVKHFRFTLSGKRRIHGKPREREVKACQPWLVAEIDSVQPKVIVCLGATAAKSLLGADFRITRERGKPLKTQWATWLVATHHPAAVLRMPEKADRDAARQQLAADLARARDLAAR